MGMDPIILILEQDRNDQVGLHRLPTGKSEEPNKCDSCCYPG